MIPDLIDKFLEENLISNEEYKSVSPLKKPYGKKFGHYFLEKGWFTSEDLKKLPKKIRIFYMNYWINI